MEALTTWLLQGPAWVRYAVRRDLLGYAPDDPQVYLDRKEMLQDESVCGLVDLVTDWPWPPLTRHNDANHPLHALAFLADLGLSLNDGLSGVADRLLAEVSSEGPLQIATQIPKRFGGSGEIEPGWMLCDAPLLAAALLKLGVDDQRLTDSIPVLAGLARENGWPCAATVRLGSFRGPGRKDDPCPYANLLMLRLLAEMPLCGEVKEAYLQPATLGAEQLLSLWTQRRERRPYLFAMGTTYARPKAPLIWYDILHVLDMLTRFPWLRDDPRLVEMAAMLAAQADEQGRYTAGSVWMAWKGWEFAQKRVPSRWITFLATRALGRLGT